MAKDHSAQVHMHQSRGCGTPPSMHSRSTLDGSPSRGNRRFVEPSIFSSEVPPQDGYQGTKMSADQELGYKHAMRSVVSMQGRCSQAILLQTQLLVLNPIHQRDDQPVRKCRSGSGFIGSHQCVVKRYLNSACLPDNSKTTAQAQLL